MIDMDPRDPFDFYLDHYQEQLVAGYTKSTPDYGLTRLCPRLRQTAVHVGGKPAKEHAKEIGRRVRLP